MRRWRQSRFRWSRTTNTCRIIATAVCFLGNAECRHATALARIFCKARHGSGGRKCRLTTAIRNCTSVVLPTPTVRSCHHRAATRLGHSVGRQKKSRCHHGGDAATRQGDFFGRSVFARKRIFHACPVETTLRHPACRRGKQSARAQRSRTE